MHARGEVRLPTCGVVVPDAVEVAGLRKRWSLSQTVLARRRGSDTSTVPAWEQVGAEVTVQGGPCVQK